jgi:hypothetical protein
MDRKGHFVRSRLARPRAPCSLRLVGGVETGFLQFRPPLFHLSIRARFASLPGQLTVERSRCRIPFVPFARFFWLNYDHNLPTIYGKMLAAPKTLC